MGAYQDPRDGRWRYRKQIRIHGIKRKISGTPPLDLKESAEQAERDHIRRIQFPEEFKPEPEPIKPKGSMPTVREFIKRFLDEYALDGKPGANRTREVHLKGSITTFFGQMPLDGIDQSHINAFKAAHKSKASQTIRNKLYALFAVLRYAAELGIIEPHKLKVRVKGKGETKVEAVPEAHVAKLLKVTKDPRYIAAILLASEAGLRVGEIRGLQWTDIKDSKVTIRRHIDDRNNIGPPKNGQARVVPLSSAIENALKKVAKRGVWVLTRLADDEKARKGQKRASGPGGFLGYSGMNKAIKALYTKAKITPGADIDVWHSLRHSYGTKLAAKNVPPSIIQRLMGHADVRTTMRYITTTADQMDAAVARVFG